ncbi:pimeloyl-ACP methyl ester carboxylesterase [Actinoplanes campanulatus]|uniref:Pimeloyl-ACP methyl ester carboxylesterase n=1 Tax=Actinoplanes campanulatus TaxID=113559 RepID=A0A7W5AM51_9ACTN|nr:alpha/beta hydrolase [Actinoplanes campanulatus]MBB3098616.1 pimeloyl-ACP methyl ester carboxylesterase [Actinoplanes campanulatus]GGN36154.1 peptidase [Actinoplanes campanulatus]GID39307.1 peptidase [Actinoplanes campanulatus]
MRRLAVRVTAALALVSAVAVAPQAASASGAAPPFSWSACTEPLLIGFDCATYEVPLDHDKPRGATTTIALSRRPAGDPANKIGTIFVNPGGPGGAGRNMVRAAARIASPEVLARFDLVGFDPRGIGGSDPIQCFGTDAEAEALYARMTGVPITREQIASTLAANREYTAACEDNIGPLLTHMSTLNVAKDLDLLRQGAGDDRLTYIGYSYGTLIGATYANLFPKRVRAVILDGNVDPDQRTDHRLANKFERAGGFEIALAGYLAECDEAGAACALSGDARGKFDRLRDRLREGPVEIPGLGTITLDALTGFTGQTLYNMASFPDAAQQIQEVYDLVFGDPAGLRTAGVRLPSAPPARGWLSDDAYSYTSNDASFAVNCADAPLPRNPALYPGFAAAFEKAHPTFGRAEAFSEVGCATWPKITEAYDGPWNRRTAATILVVNPTYDPATRLDFAVRMTRQLGNARLLTLDGFGHTSNYSACISGWYTRYLIDGDLPPEGTRCAQDRVPFPAV